MGDGPSVDIKPPTPVKAPGFVVTESASGLAVAEKFTRSEGIRAPKETVEPKEEPLPKDEMADVVERALDVFSMQEEANRLGLEVITTNGDPLKLCAAKGKELVAQAGEDPLKMRIGLDFQIGPLFERMKRLARERDQTTDPKEKMKIQERASKINAELTSLLDQRTELTREHPELSSNAFGEFAKQFGVEVDVLDFSGSDPEPLSSVLENIRDGINDKGKRAVLVSKWKESGMPEELADQLDGLMGARHRVEVGKVVGKKTGIGVAALIAGLAATGYFAAQMNKQQSRR